MEQEALLQDQNEKPLLYLADIRPLCSQELMRRVYFCVDEKRRQKADACRSVQAKAASLAAGFLAEYALRQYEKAEGQRRKGASCMGVFRIEYGKKGQPIVCPKEECQSPEEGFQKEKGTPYVSLSHSGDYAVCAIAKVPVGVDIQKRQPVRSGMLRHFFTEGEERDFLRRHLGEEPPKEREGAFGSRTADCLGEGAETEFLRLWTMKESYMKLTGAGMGIGFVALQTDRECKTIWERGTGDKKEAGGTCRIWEYAAPAGYFLTACTKTV